VGMKVDAKYHTAKRFFPATIVRHNFDDTFACRFEWGPEKGETIDVVKRTDIRLPDSRLEEGQWKDVFEISEIIFVRRMGKLAKTIGSTLHNTVDTGRVLIASGNLAIPRPAHACEAMHLCEMVGSKLIPSIDDEEREKWKWRALNGVDSDGEPRLESKAFLASLKASIEVEMAAEEERKTETSRFLGSLASVTSTGTCGGGNGGGNNGGGGQHRGGRGGRAGHGKPGRVFLPAVAVQGSGGSVASGVSSPSLSAERRGLSRGRQRGANAAPAPDAAAKAGCHGGSKLREHRGTGNEAKELPGPPSIGAGRRASVLAAARAAVSAVRLAEESPAFSTALKRRLAKAKRDAFTAAADEQGPHGGGGGGEGDEDVAVAPVPSLPGPTTGSLLPDVSPVRRTGRPGVVATGP